MRSNRLFSCVVCVAAMSWLSCSDKKKDGVEVPVEDAGEVEMPSDSQDPAVPPPTMLGPDARSVLDISTIDIATADTAVADTAVADTAIADTAIADTTVVDTAALEDAEAMDIILLPDAAPPLFEDILPDTIGEITNDSVAATDSDLTESTDATATQDALGAGEPDGPVVILDTELPVDNTWFPLGVSAGAARYDSVMCWTKYTGVETVSLKVWRPLDIPEQVVLAYDAEVVPADGGYIKVRVTGLLPDTLYYYAFFLESQRSYLGVVRTALAPGEKRAVTFAASSCTSQFYQPWPSLSLMAEYDVDAILHVGDMSYNDGATNIDEYRDAWEGTLTQDGYRDLLLSGGLYVTWDDHEVDNDWNPETMDSANVLAAKQAYFETLPNDKGPDYRLWNSYAWGDTLEIFILDCRSERKPSTTQSGAGPDEYISPEQMAWLKDGLSNSTATYKVVLNSVPITDMPFFYFGENDRWEDYSDQRSELLSYIFDNDINGVWFISGDFHLGFVSWVENSGPGENVREIAVGPGGNLNPVGLLAGLFPQSQFDFFHGNPETATLITFDPEAETVFIQFIDAWDGDVLLAQEFPGVIAP